MADNHSKARQTAEKAFDRARTQTIARDRAHEELDSDTKARQEKTSRLREARLAQEAQNSPPSAGTNIKKS